MRVGDIIVYNNHGDYCSQYYTVGKHYIIYKVKDDFIPGVLCGWIFDDNGQSVYFRDDDNDENWVYLKKNREEKIKKINGINSK